MGIIEDLQNDINNLKKGIDKKWLEEHVKHLEDPGCRVDGFDFLHDLHAADYIWSKEQIRQNKKMVEEMGLAHDLDVPKKLYVIAVELNKMFNKPNIEQEKLVKTCSDKISESYRAMSWKDKGEETYDGMTYTLKKFRSSCSKNVLEAEKDYNLIIKNLTDDLKNVADGIQSEEELGSSVSLLYAKWGIRDLGKLWGTWEKTFRKLINDIKTKKAGEKPAK